MTDKPFEPLLGRESAVTSADVHEGRLSLLHDLANYGSNLMRRAYSAGERSITDAVIVFHMLREIVIQVDALYVLLTNGCGPATASICRSLVEKSHLLRWTLKYDSEEKVKFLLVGDCRTNLKRARIAIPGTPENLEIGRVVGRTPDDPELIRRSILDEERFRRFLALAPLVEIEEAFQNHKSEQPWTKVYCKAKGDKLCRGSARSIAEYLGSLADYIIYYADYSARTHGASVWGSVGLEDEKCRVVNVRGTEELISAWRLGANSAIESYLDVIRHFCPDEEVEFFEKYKRDWRERLG